MTQREKAILCGLFLSRCDTAGLERLGFASFKEAYNILGLAIGVKPASIKNYRDELDPLFPNKRRGWHGRPLRPHCEKVYETYKSHEVDELVSLIARFTGCDFDSAADDSKCHNDSTAHAKRLLTGRAAENYFLSNFNRHPEFTGSSAKDVTQAGCGFDFALTFSGNHGFFAVEVKGLSTANGTVSLTENEYRKAAELERNYFLYVVRNFDESPEAVTIRNPAYSEFPFVRRERRIIEVTWATHI